MDAWSLSILNIKVLYVHHCATVGGAGVSLLNLINGMKERGVQVEVCLNTVPGSLTEYFDRLGIEYNMIQGVGTFGHAHGAKESFFKWMWPWSIWKNALRIYPDAIRFRNWVQDMDVDIVHINSMVQLAAGWGAKMAGKKVVWHIREELHPGILGIRRNLIRFLIDYCANCIIAISEVNSSKINLKRKCTVVYNYVDKYNFNTEKKSCHFRKKYIGYIKNSSYGFGNNHSTWISSLCKHKSFC